MWLRLTDTNSSKDKLVNMDKVNYIEKSSIQSGSWLDCGGDAYIDVKESIDEIELMLAGKGVEIRRNERSWIGREFDENGNFK